MRRIREMSRGGKADVTAAGQLKVAETDPANFISIQAASLRWGHYGGECRTVYTVPAAGGRSLILSAVAFHPLALSNARGWINVYVENATQLQANGACDFKLATGIPTVVTSWDFGGPVVPGAAAIAPGFVVPAGSTIYAAILDRDTTSTTDTLAADLYASGYFVPSAAAPKETQVIRTGGRG